MRRHGCARCSSVRTFSTCWGERGHSSNGSPDTRSHANRCSTLRLVSPGGENVDFSYTSCVQGAAIMERRKVSDFPPGLLCREYHDGNIDRRSFLNGACRFASGALTVGTSLEMRRPSDAWAQQVATVTHPPSARVLDQLRTRFTFQISVDVATVEQGFGVASAGLAGGVNIVEMGTPLLKN